MVTITVRGRKKAEPLGPWQLTGTEKMTVDGKGVPLSSDEAINSFGPIVESMALQGQRRVRCGARPGSVVTSGEAGGGAVARLDSGSTRGSSAMVRWRRKKRRTRRGDPARSSDR
jgi:hypothetical protein